MGLFGLAGLVGCVSYSKKRTNYTNNWRKRELKKSDARFYHGIKKPDF